MNRKLVEIVAHTAVFLEFSDENTVNMETAVRELEDLSFRLRQLSSSEQQEFVAVLKEIAKEHPYEKEREFLLELPNSMGFDT